MLRHQGCVYPACEGHELKTLSDLAASHPRPMVRRASAVLLVSVLSENAVVQRRALSSSAVWNLEEWLVVAPKAGLYASPLKNSLIETLRRAEEALALGLLAGRPSSLPAGIKNRKVLAEIKAGPDGLISAVGVRLRREKTQKPTVSQRTLCKTPQMIPKETEQELWRGGGILKGGMVLTSPMPSSSFSLWLHWEHCNALMMTTSVSTMANSLVATPVSFVDCLRRAACITRTLSIRLYDCYESVSMLVIPASVTRNVSLSHTQASWTCKHLSLRVGT